MTACDELRPNAAGIASLPEGDPERQAYLTHAKDCPGCMAALREGEKLMSLLSRVDVPAPSPEALRRARQGVLAEMQAAPRRAWLVQAAATVAGFFVPVLLARHLQMESWAAAAVMLVAATALAATAGALRAGALVVLAASAGFAFAAGGVPAVWPTGTDLRPAEFICTGMEQVAAALPLAAAAFAYRSARWRGSLAQAAAAGALAGQAALHLACPGRNDALHLWMFHVSGVAVAAIAGWMVEGQLIRARS